jgi:O-antigen/teichoic acid export membrane protein
VDAVLLRLILDTKFYDAAAFIPVVALIPILQNLRGMLTTGFEMSKKPSWIFLLTTAGMAALVASAFILEDSFGALGIAASVACGWAMTGLATYIYSQRVYPINYNMGLLFVVGAGTFIVYWVPLDFIKSSIVVLLVKSIIGAVLVLISYLVLERKKSEKQFFLKLLRIQ